MRSDLGPLLSGGSMQDSRCCSLALFIWACYTMTMIFHLQKMIEAPQTRRVVRDMTKYRLPNFYFCPADRTQESGRAFSWKSFDCHVTYKRQRAECSGQTRPYEGDSPDEFKADGRDAGGSCLELFTHDISIKQEWTAAWNEITMRVAFFSDMEGENALQEVEVGYRPVEWQTGPNGWRDRYYYPLLRVPAFTIDVPANPVGMAVRAYLQEEIDHEVQGSGRYWYTYGGMQVPVLNVSVPRTPIIPIENSVRGRLRIAHIVLTIEDFEMYGVEEVSYFYPMLGIVGEIAGFSALLALLCRRCCASGLDKLGKIGTAGNDADGLGAEEVVIYSEVATDEQDEPEDRDQGPSSRRALLEAAE
mmetsp:Transcript_31438/g.57100  ORF Transcript_31438/g.57100 Transcript_31438/m.57100 type:complete len:360 (-) Transcript_31438:103-1182(-)